MADAVVVTYYVTKRANAREAGERRPAPERPSTSARQGEAYRSIDNKAGWEACATLGAPPEAPTIAGAIAEAYGTRFGLPARQSPPAAFKSVTLALSRRPRS